MSSRPDPAVQVRDLSGDSPQQDDDLDALADLAGPSADLRPRAVSLEELTLAWLAHERTSRRGDHA